MVLVVVVGEILVHRRGHKIVLVRIVETLNARIEVDVVVKEVERNLVAIDVAHYDSSIKEVDQSIAEIFDEVVVRPFAHGLELGN